MRGLGFNATPINRDAKPSESGFSGFKDSQDDFIENPSLQRSDMSIEGDVSKTRAPVLNPDLSGRSAM